MNHDDYRKGFINGIVLGFLSGFVLACVGVLVAWSWPV